MSTTSHDEPAPPSQMQINGLRNACDRFGYSGMHDPRFIGFVRSVAGVDHPRFLTRAKASVVLVELLLMNMFGTTLGDLPTSPQMHQ